MLLSTGKRVICSEKISWCSNSSSIWGRGRGRFLKSVSLCSFFKSVWELFYFYWNHLFLVTTKQNNKFPHRLYLEGIAKWRGHIQNLKKIISCTTVWSLESYHFKKSEAWFMVNIQSLHILFWISVIEPVWTGLYEIIRINVFGNFS